MAGEVALLSQALDATQAEWGDSFVPDFILDSDTCPSLSRPMSYLQALVCLRWAIQLPWRSEGGQLVTRTRLLRSPFTALNARCSVRLPEDSRRLGHHRLSSALLYSRDDTIEALWVQSELASAIRRGWRPPRPMARGGQRPTVEPVFQVPQESPPGQLELPSLPQSLARFLYHWEVDNLLSAALNTDEEALAVERAALDSSEAESEELPDENPHSPEPLHRPLAPTLAVDSIGIRLAPWGSVHAVLSTHSSSVQTACGLHFKECSYPVRQIHNSSGHAALQTQSLHGPAVLK